MFLNNNKNTKINGFSNGYKDQYELSMAVTNLGTFQSIMEIINLCLQMRSSNI